MNCEQYDAALSDYVDGALQASERPEDLAMLEALEAHLTGCERCRTLVEDFHTLRESARALEQRQVPPQIWSNIAASIDRPAAVRPFRWHREALAAAALVVLLAGGSWFAWQRLAPKVDHAAATAAAPAEGPDPELMQDVETQLKLAEEHYLQAIAGLETITRAESSTLDQETAEVLQTNLDVIDRAIGESRAALRAQPASEIARQSLFEALRSKVTLLQGTVALINETRKG